MLLPIAAVPCGNCADLGIDSPLAMAVIDDGNRAAALREAKAAQELAKMGQMALQIAEALRPQ